MPRVIHLTLQNLAYVETPKVASTTMIEFMHALAGLPPVYSNPRKAARKRKIKSRLEELGVKSFSLSGEGLAAFQATNPSIYWVAVTREPYTRLVSAYHSKLHRYAEAFDKKAFWKGTLGRFRDGIKAIDDSRYLAKHVGLRISFDEMVEGIYQYGVDFDSHFDLQVRILCVDIVKYDMLIEVADLENGLRKVCLQLNRPYPFVNGIPKRNSSLGPKRVPISPTSETLEKIAQIYAKDYSVLNYAVNN